MKTGIVVIGRNEGSRLAACLQSLRSSALPIVYVDSGSTDGSSQNAQNFGATVVNLDSSAPFTAARGRNAGLKRLQEMRPDLHYAQFADGDCTVEQNWLSFAEGFLDTHIEVAAVSGRLREMHPLASIYNWLCDIEWDGPAGEVSQCGGIAMMRIAAVNEVGGFREALPAGEEPELCLRMREKGWRIWRIQEEMARHDADMHTFGEWWKRAVRGGVAFAEVSTLHAASPKRIWHRETLRAVFWGLFLPLVIAAASIFSFGALWLLLLYPLQIARIAIRRGAGEWINWRYGLFMTIGKFAEAFGVMKYFLVRR